MFACAAALTVCNGIIVIRHKNGSSFFPECVGKGFSFYFGGLGVETCSLGAAFMSATVRNHPRTSKVGVAWPCLWRVLQM